MNTRARTLRQKSSLLARKAENRTPIAWASRLLVAARRKHEPDQRFATHVASDASNFDCDDAANFRKSRSQAARGKKALPPNRLRKPNDDPCQSRQGQAITLRQNRMSIVRPTRTARSSQANRDHDHWYSANIRVLTMHIVPGPAARLLPAREWG